MKERAKLEKIIDSLALRFGIYQKRCFLGKQKTFWGIIDLLLSWTFLLPTSIVSIKYPQYALPMFILNIVFGFTGVGWSVLLVLALTIFSTKLEV